MTVRKRGASLGKSAGKVRIYTLVVSVLSGPGTTAFSEENAPVSRTLQVRGDQTLADLHRAICGAFGHSGEPLYEFQFGQGPMDPEGPRYVLPGAYDVSVDD